MRHLVWIAFACWAGLSPNVGAVTINLTLGADLVSIPGRVTFAVAVENAADGSAVSINGYTLDFTFDGSELSFVSTQQLVSFGGLGQLGFTSPNNCSASSKRCTAGNVPGFDATSVDSLFSVSFDILQAIEDGQVDFTAGVLDSRFDDVTQATGQQPFDHGKDVVSYALVPEPSSFPLLALGAAALAIVRERARRESQGAISTRAHRSAR